MNATAPRKTNPNKVLITGASGLLEVAAIEKFLTAGCEVVGVSRRKPELPSGRDVEFLAAPRAFVSTIKLRQAGFSKTIDTEVSFRNALRSLIDHKLLPPGAK